MEGDLTIERLRDVVDDSHLNFLMGAGASASMFDALGDVEDALTGLSKLSITDELQVARASIYARFFDGVLAKNIDLVANPTSAEPLLVEYRRFLTSLNRILLRRRSSLLNKQANIFTTNVDLAFEVSLEQLGLDLNDGFSGKFQPKFSTGNFGSLRQRRSLQYENLSEVPTFNLLKLHGSAGWTPSDGSSELDFDVRLTNIDTVKDKLDTARSSLVAINSDERIMMDGTTISVVRGDRENPEIVIADLVAEAASHTMDDSISEFMVEYEKLAIVNPTKEKFQTTVLNQNYYDLFRAFANELEKENSVLFVFGFSFRDEHIRELIVRAARTNPTLQIYIFCYKNSQADAIKSLIGEKSVKNGNIILIRPNMVAGEEEGQQVEQPMDLGILTRNYFEPIIPPAKQKPDVNVVVNLNAGDDDETSERSGQ